MRNALVEIKRRFLRIASSSISVVHSSIPIYFDKWEHQAEEVWVIPILFLRNCILLKYVIKEDTFLGDSRAIYLAVCLPALVK